MARRRYTIKLKESSWLISPHEDSSVLNRPEIVERRSQLINSRTKFARDKTGKLKSRLHCVRPREGLSPDDRVELTEFLHLSGMLKADHTVITVGARRGYYAFLDKNDALLFKLRWG